MSPTVGLPLVDRIYRIKRLSDNIIFEKGSEVVYNDLKYKIVKFSENDEVNDEILYAEIIRDNNTLSVPCDIIDDYNILG
jgi:hypothetical protein